MQMADNFNIRLPDGTTIPVPAWATESTLEKITFQMDKANDLDDKLFSLMRGVSLKSEDIIEILEDIIEHQDETEEERQKDNKLNAKNIAQGVTKTISKFNDTDKPLSKMVDMAGELGGSLFEGIKGSGKSAKSTGVFAEALDMVAPGLEAVGGAALAYAGWNAAKLEQFAEAQGKMIDAGAIFYSSGDMFDQMYSRAMDAGITYTQLTDIVGSHGAAIQSLGNGVSQGSSNFLSMFTRLNESTDELGDLGLRSGELAEAYADYINVVRLTGMSDMRTRAGQDAVQQSFTNLVVESTALANLTSENRSDILKRQMAALSDPELAAALKTMRDRGNINQADVAEEFTKQLALMAPQLGDIGSQLTDAINGEIFATVENPQNFDIRKRLDPTTIAAFEDVMPGLVDRINNSIRTGDVENAGNMLVEAFANMDQQRRGSSIAGANTFLGVVQALQAAGMMVDQDMGRLADMTEQERQTAIAESRSKLAESGGMTKAMNDLTIAFLNVQDSITINLNDASQTVEGFAKTIREGAQNINDFFGFGSDPDPALEAARADAQGRKITTDQRERVVGDTGEAAGLTQDQAESAQEAMRSGLRITDDQKEALEALSKGLENQIGTTADEFDNAVESLAERFRSGRVNSGAFRAVDTFREPLVKRLEAILDDETLSPDEVPDYVRIRQSLEKAMGLRNVLMDSGLSSRLLGEFEGSSLGELGDLGYEAEELGFQKNLPQQPASDQLNDQTSNYVNPRTPTIENVREESSIQPASFETSSNTRDIEAQKRALQIKEDQLKSMREMAALTVKAHQSSQRDRKLSSTDT